MEKIKIIALDMDGTTLNNEKTITEETLLAIQKAHQQGILIVPATGRSLSGIPKELIELPIRYCILKNGAIVYDLLKKEEIYHDIIDNDLVSKFADATKDLMTFTSIGYGEQKEACYSPNKDLVFKMRPASKRNEDFFVDDLSFFIKQNQPKIDKITQVVFDQQTADIILKLQEQFLGLNIMNSGYPFIEINSRMCSKGNGLKKLATKLNLTRENIAAIGDSDNDIIMLAYAGYSFAMANGTQFIRNIADEITDDNNHQGVKKAIDKILTYNQKCL